MISALRGTVLVSLALLCAAPGAGQTFRPGGAVTDTNPQPIKLRCWSGAAFEDCVAGKQEAFQLVAGNTPSAPQSVFGGDYVLSQACAGYGTLTLQALGPDGATWVNVAVRTASDTGAGIVLGSYARVRVTLTGTAGCNAILARVPA